MDRTLGAAGEFGRFADNVDGVIEGAGLVGDALGLFGERPSLLAFPVVGALISFGIGLVGLAGLFLVWTTVGFALGWPALVLSALAVLFVTYFSIAFVNTFFVAALVHEVYDYHHGIELSVVSGMRAAARNWWPLFLWSAINWTVGRLLKRTRNRGSRRGAAMMGEAVSTGWTATTFFVVPVILFEDARGREMIQKSAGHFRESWEQILAAVLGLRLIGWAIGSVGAAFAGLFVVGEFALVALPIALFFGVVGSLITLSLQGVLKGTVYEHLTAADHDVADVVPSEYPQKDASDDPVGGQ